MGSQRTCVGCRRVAPPDTLVRVKATDDGRLIIDGRLGGRGAWLCAASPECLGAAIRSKGFHRALRIDIQGASVDALRRSLGYPETSV
ncbi:MAG: YlxR family protein [Acidimicrobiales bacterium]